MNSTKIIIKAQTTELENLQGFHDMFLCQSGNANTIALMPQIGLSLLRAGNAVVRLTTAEMAEQFEADEKIIQNLTAFTYFEVLPSPPAKTKTEQAAPRLLIVVKEFIETGYYNTDTGTKARLLVNELES